jgi:hypothetical protein
MNYFEIKEIHCYIDNVLFNYSKKILSNVSKYLNDSDIYTVSLLLTLAIPYFIYLNDKYNILILKLIPGLLFFLSYFMNILYHVYIQTYKLQDHINNNFWTLVTYILILKLIYKKNRIIFTLIFILMIPIICNWGCQIKYIKQYNKNIKAPLFNELCSLMCPFSDKLENIYKNNKLIGNGTLILLISIYLIFI